MTTWASKGCLSSALGGGRGLVDMRKLRYGLVSTSNAIGVSLDVNITATTSIPKQVKNRKDQVLSVPGVLSSLLLSSALIVFDETGVDLRPSFSGQP